MATTTQVGGVLSQARRMSRGRRIVAVAGVAVAVVLAVGVVQLRSSDSLRTAANLDRSAVTVGAEGASITGVTASGAADNVDVLRAADGRTGAGSAGSAASAASADSTKSLSAGGRIAPPPPVSVAAIPSGGPRVVRTVDLRLEVAANGMADVMGQVAVIANGAGGFVQSSSSTASTPSAVVRDPGASPVTVPARATASAVIRVPSQRSAEVTEALAKLGKVVGRSEQGQDVTGQLVDLDSRLRNLRAQEDALRTLVARAGSVGEVLAVQGQLFEVRGQIEQIAGQQGALANQADLATITVNVAEPPVGPGPRPPAGHRGVMARAGSALQDSAAFVATAVLVGGASVLPFAALLAVIVGVWFVVRIPLRRRTGRVTVAVADDPAAAA